jgi:hypothetical protein
VSLLGYFLRNEGRPINRWRHYLAIYEKHLQALEGKAVTLLEIGVDGGGSLQMWKWFLGPKARIIGLDENPECFFEESQIEVVIGDQTDQDMLRTLAEMVGGFDVVIDDGKHRFKQQRASFEALYESTRYFYAVEDLHTAYLKQYGGGVGKEQFIEFAKRNVDALSAWHVPGIKVGEFTRTTLGVHFYDSLCIFEKGIVEPPQTMVTGNGNR